MSACLNTELVHKLFINDLQSVGTTALREFLAIFQSQLFRYNDEFLDLGLQAWCGPDNTTNGFLKTFI